MRGNDSLYSNSMEGVNNTDVEDETHQGALNVKDIANRFNSNRRKTSFKPAWAKSLPKSQKADTKQPAIERKTNSVSIPFRNNTSTADIEYHADQQTNHNDVRPGSQEKRSLDKEIETAEQGTKFTPDAAKTMANHPAKSWKGQKKILPATDTSKQYISPKSIKNSSTLNGNDHHQVGENIISKPKSSPTEHMLPGEGRRDTADEVHSVPIHKEKDTTEENQIPDMKSRIAKFSQLGSTDVSMTTSKIPWKKEEQSKGDQEGRKEQLNSIIQESEESSDQADDKKSLQDTSSLHMQVEQTSTGHFWRNQMKRNSSDLLNFSSKKEGQITSKVNETEESSGLIEKKVLQGDELVSKANVVDPNTLENISKAPDPDDGDQTSDSNTISKFHSPKVEFITTSESVGTNIMIWKQREKQNENVMKPIEPVKWKQHNIPINQPRRVSKNPEEKVLARPPLEEDVELHSSQGENPKQVHKHTLHSEGAQLKQSLIISKNEAQDPPQIRHQIKSESEIQRQAKNVMDKINASSSSLGQKSLEMKDSDENERYKNFMHRNTHDLSFESQEASFDVEELKKRIGFYHNRKIDTDLDNQGIACDLESGVGMRNDEKHAPLEQHSLSGKINMKHVAEETPLRSNGSINLSSSREEIAADQFDRPGISQLKKQLWGTGEKLKTWQSRAFAQSNTIQTNKSENKDIVLKNDYDSFTDSAEQMDQHVDTNKLSSRESHRIDKIEASYEPAASDSIRISGNTTDKSEDDDSRCLPIHQRKQQLWGTDEKLKTRDRKGMTQSTAIQRSKSEDDDVATNHMINVDKDQYADTNKASSQDIMYSRGMTQGAFIQRSQSVDTGIVFKDRFYHAAKVAQQIDGGINTHNPLNKVIHGSLHGEEHDILRQSNQSSIASSKPESIRHNGLLPSDLERNTEKASSSVEKLLEKLAAALNSKDNPDAALQEIDSILRKERQGLGEGKHIHTMQATIMEDETLEYSNADEFAHVKDGFSDDEDEDYSDDDSTVSSITNPTYHESFQRHSPRSRAYGPIYQTGPQKGLPLPSAKPVSLTHPKVLEQYISSKRYDERLNTRFHGHEDVVHVQLDRSKNSSMEGKGEISGLESSLSPVKAFSEKGRSMNNKGLVNQIKGWDDLEEVDGSHSKNPRGRIDVKDPSPPFSPSDRLKRLANAATKYEQRQNLRHRRRGLSATPERNRVFYPSGDDMNKGKEQYDPFDTNSDDWESIPGFDFFKSEQESLAQAFHGNSFASKSIPEQVSELRRQQRERNSHAHRMDVLDQS